MASEPEAPIHGFSIEETDFDGLNLRETYAISTVGGRAVTIFSLDNRFYSISDLQVDGAARRKGIGGNLTHTALQHAKQIGADAVMAAITSRECFDVMIRVFGEEAVEVYELGDYAPEGRDSHPTDVTMASLWYDLR